MESKGREIYKENFAEYLLCLALDIGEGLLKNGGEVARVEDAIERVCSAYGAIHVEVFSTISVIHASIRLEDGSFSSQMRRVKQVRMDLGKLEKLNALSREACGTKMPLPELDKRITEVKGTKTYPNWLIALAMALSCGSFAMMFGGSITDGITSSIIGLIASILEFIPTKRLNGMAKTAISSCLIGVLAALSTRIGFADSSGTVVIGSIMMLVPGLFFGTAMRDLLCGDLATGSLKTLQAVLEAIMLAFGYMLAVVIMGGVAI